MQTLDKENKDMINSRDQISDHRNGEMERLTKAFDWSKTSIGSSLYWPASLHITIDIMLSSKFPMFLWWGEKKVQFYNDAYRPSLGDQGRHPLALGQEGEPCWEEIWKTIGPLINQVYTGGEATWSEDQLIPISRNGKIEDVYWTFGYSAVRGLDKQIEGVLVICTETTKKVLAIKQIEEKEAELRNTILKAPIGMCILTGPDHVVDIANEKMIEVWGKTAEEIMNKPIFEGVFEAQDQGFEKLLKQVYETGKPHVAHEIPIFLPRDGKLKKVYVSLIYEPCRNEHDIITGVYAVVIDVTARVLAQEQIEQIVEARTKELNEVNLKLQKTNEELEQFAHITSHDLQEPLRKISVFSQLLEQKVGLMDNDSRTYLGKINICSNRMVNLIRDLLGYSEVAKQESSYTTIDLNDVIGEIISDLEILILQKKAFIEHGVLPTIEADPVQMAQLFGNIISNSLKYSKSDVFPVITISSKEVTLQEIAFNSNLIEGNTYYKIEIADNGIGFSQQYSQQIFSIFQRLHNKTEYGGTGIGLALCKKIVQKHSGDIFAEGKTGEGAKFTVILPLKHN
ncbi:sensor histidine kinase [Flavobacterium sp. NPDC079362]|uniref:sensor histidine kinase n=1 Tax=Flavobacterium sp. NPDC079362 TaxID=3390566 RepID=UPI003D08E8C7